MSTKNWNQVYKEGSKYAPVSEIVLDKLELRGGLALDIGCGEGELMCQLQSRGYKTTGIDLAEAAKPDIIGDFMEYDFGDVRYDLITVNLVLAFIQDKEKFVKKIKSLLKPGGRVIIITPVLYKKYLDKYSAKDISISVEFDDLEKLFHDYIIHDTNHAGGYHCRITIEPKF